MTKHTIIGCEPTSHLRWNEGVLEQKWRITDYSHDGHGFSAASEPRGEVTFEWRPVETISPVPGAHKLKVKPLEWNGTTATDGSLCYSYHGGRLYFGETDDETMDAYSSLDEAKAAAQADYERRILSAIVEESKE